MDGARNADRLLTFPVCVPRICLKNRDFSCGAALGCAIKYLIYFLLLCMPPETSLLRQKRKIPWKEPLELHGAVGDLGARLVSGKKEALYMDW